MKKIITLALFLLLAPGLLGGCGGENADTVTSASQSAAQAASSVQTISPEEAKGIMDTTSDLVILDVREQNEYDAGHLPGALLMPYKQTKQQAETLLPEKDQPVLVYCRTGVRSSLAAEELAQMGYTYVLDLKGGITAWSFETEQ